MTCSPQGNCWHSQLWLHFQPLCQEKPQPSLFSGCLVGSPCHQQHQGLTDLSLWGAAACRGGSSRACAACAHWLLGMAALPASHSPGGEPACRSARAARARAGTACSRLRCLLQHTQ